jgi:hypothetical protein
MPAEVQKGAAAPQSDAEVQPMHAAVAMSQMGRLGSWQSVFDMQPWRHWWSIPQR